jgi:dienelactone hydrolase
MRTLHAVALTAAAVLLAGCSSSSSVGPTNPTAGNGAPPPITPAPAAFRPYFQLAQGLLPYPTDLFLTGSVDGTVNAPTSQVTPNTVAVNALDGFGVNGEITVRFSSAIDVATLSRPGAITVLETQMLTLTTGTTVARVPVAVRRPMIPGVDYSATLSAAVDAGGQVLSITPLKPLTPSTGGSVFDPTHPPPGLPPGALDASGVGYLVILTGTIQSTAGAPAQADNDYAAIRTAVGTPNAANPTAGCATLANPTLQSACQVVAPHLLIAAGAKIPLSAIALTFSFTTESTRDTLVKMATAVANAATPAPLAAQGLPNGAGGFLTTKNLLDPKGTNPALIGNADVYEGTLTIPYYLPTPADATAADPAPPLTGQWLSGTAVSFVPGQPGSKFVTRYNPLPAVRHTVAIPVLLTIPNATSKIAKPASGWPVAIFVHGLGGNRTNALAIAESYARAGIAVAAIDMPVHGITPTEATAVLRIPGVAERTFDVDYFNNATRQPPADGVVDASGTIFLVTGATSPITTRDIERQGIIDNLTLAKALTAAVIVGAAGPVASPFDPNKISLSGQSLGGITGTMVASLPSNIQSFGLSVPGGPWTQITLESATFGPIFIPQIAAQLGLNTLLFKVFIRDSQAALDAADPLNHVAIAAASKPILLHKVVGDSVVPNSTTDRLIAAGGFMKANAAGPWPARSDVTFTKGTHGSLLDPTASAAVTVEMQTEIVSFAAAGGAGFPITDASSVQP